MPPDEVKAMEWYSKAAERGTNVPRYCVFVFPEEVPPKVNE